MRVKRLLATAVVATAVFAVSACGSGGESGGGEGGGDSQTVNIGYSGPLSGGAALYGENVLTGLQMAVDEINEDGLEIDGQETTLEVASLDDRYLPNETATNARRLLQQEEAPVVFVPHSGGILALQDMNTGRNPFLLAAYSSVPEIAEADNPLTVMIPPRYDNYMQPFTEVEMENFGPRLGLIPTESDYGQKWTEEITAEWESQGGEVLSDNGFDYNTQTDYAGPVTQALAEDPDVLFVGGPSQPTAQVIETARSQGFEGGFIVMDQAKFSEMAEFTSMENLNGGVGILPIVAYSGPGTEQFLSYYEETAGPDSIPTSEVAWNYEAMHVIAEAMQLAGTATDPEAIRAEMGEAARQLEDQYKPYPLDGITDQGHLEGPVIAALVENGEYTEVEVPQEQ